MWSDICAACPPVEAARRQALKVAYRTISATVGPIVTEAWNKAAEAAKPLKVKVEGILAEQFDKLVQVKAEIKTKLKAGMATALAPLVEIVSKVLGDILKGLIPPIVGGLKPVIDKVPDMSTKLTEAITAADDAKAKEIRDIVSTAKAAAYKAMEEEIKKVLEALIGECGKALAQDCLKALLWPFGKIINIINSIVELIDPENYMDVVVFLMKEKDKLVKVEDHSKVDDIQHKLDSEEWEAEWRIRWNGYSIRSAGRELWWDLSTVLVDLGPVPDVFWQLACDLQKRIHKRSLKKFSWKFGDYLYGAMTTASDTREWAVKVNDSFMIGYRRALKCAKKNLYAMVGDYAVAVVQKPIMGPIQKEILPKIKEAVMDPLESLIPEPLRELLDLSGLAISSITESIEDAIKTVVLAQGTVCAAELLKLGITV
eukprot:TRINITY_DN407_c0_g1_i9.p1 TRINITY_DN407_c0_g1~~TRINITY_DN407_c0_g1_i9.p1  ORF type:complete len:428 (+),score=158.82 TRINITY_DN407_c0_g1_i9:137-1420(+)